MYSAELPDDGASDARLAGARPVLGLMIALADAVGSTGVVVVPAGRTEEATILGPAKLEGT